MKEQKVIHGNNIDVLKTMSENSIDSIVTDPPYGLSFMNKHWDYDVPTVEFWKEALRVLKPGGHLLCACGTRTQHRMVVNIEDGGFEIRDVISWIYGSGFPKSMDVSKAIDKKNGRFYEDGFKDYANECRNKKGFSLNQINELLGTATNGGGVASALMGDKERNELPTLEMYRKLKTILDMDDRFGSLIEMVEAEREVIAEQTKARSTSGNSALPTVGGKVVYKTWDITAPSTDAAKQWQGWGTALKPATEFWTLARKPISENTIAENVLKWGTGAIWIDGCRVGETGARNNGSNPGKDGYSSNEVYGKYKAMQAIDYNTGRFPANLILDQFAADLLDEQSGQLTSGKPMGQKHAANNVYGQYGTGIDITGYGDTGGASRFFYVAKPSKEERERGLNKRQKVKVNDGRDTPIDNAFQRGETERQNTHPTVKPIQLMRYLVKMITPKGGVCLDPFCGSGTTIIACKLELVSGIGIEREKEYVDIANARLTKWNPDLYKPQELFL